MRIVRVAVLILLCLLSAAALLFTLPWLKEGYGWEETPLFASIALGLALAALLWWRLNKSVRTPLFHAGLVILGLPFAVYCALLIDNAADEFAGRRMASGARLAEYRETPIVWKNFDGPIGLTIEFEAHHSIDRAGNLQSPVIAMEPSISYQTYYQDFSRAQLMSPLMGTDPLPTLGSSPAKLRYDLFPSNVQRKPREDHICIKEAKYVSTLLRSNNGESLSAGWFFAARSGAIADLSEKMTEAVRRHNAWQGRPDQWKQMFERVQPAGLEKAGFRPCAEQKPGWGEICYCR